MKIATVNEEAMLNDTSINVKCFRTAKWFITIYDYDNIYEVYLRHENSTRQELVIEDFKCRIDYDGLMKKIENELLTHTLEYIKGYLDN